MKFLGILKDELNTNNMLNIGLIEIYDDIQKRCWKQETSYVEGAFIEHYPYFDKKLEKK